MGAVFRGTDTALGRTVAIKVLLQQYSDDEETTQRFQNEAQSTARLDHDNIARVYYVGQDRGWHYIVLEFIEGQNLRDLVYRHGPLTLENAVNYTLQISDALQHASSRDVVHRDIKPSNVLIGRDGHIKLVDMGLARLHQVDNSQEDLTATGVTLGTFDYISPEQARDPRNADVRSDLYSLGCTLYFMLTAEPPFPEGTVLQKLLRHQGDSPPDPQVIRPDLPEVSGVCTSCFRTCPWSCCATLLRMKSHASSVSSSPCSRGAALVFLSVSVPALAVPTITLGAFFRTTKRKEHESERE